MSEGELTCGLCGTVVGKFQMVKHLQNCPGADEVGGAETEQDGRKV